ncbi:MAG: hypothetical protein GY759_09550 [Chloroflexi bacterium]|nr:hypothetical protein [Chloroflexota bacterium]
MTKDYVKKYMFQSRTESVAEFSSKRVQEEFTDRPTLWDDQVAATHPQGKGYP